MLFHFKRSHHTSDLGIVAQDKNGIDCIWLQRRIRPTVKIKWRSQRPVLSPNKIKEMLSHTLAYQMISRLSRVKPTAKKISSELELFCTTVNISDSKQWCIDTSCVRILGYTGCRDREILVLQPGKKANVRLIRLRCETLSKSNTNV